jgi:ferredoxin
MAERHRIEFPGTEFSALELETETELALTLSVINSPILFGCRSGICGTCLVEVEAMKGELRPPEKEEMEALSIYAPDNPKARLACQFQLTADVQMQKIDPL